MESRLCLPGMLRQRAANACSIHEDTVPAQGFYVFIRALQALTAHNKGVVLVRS